MEGRPRSSRVHRSIASSTLSTLPSSIAIRLALLSVLLASRARWPAKALATAARLLGLDRGQHARARLLRRLTACAGRVLLGDGDDQHLPATVMQEAVWIGGRTAWANSHRGRSRSFLRVVGVLGRAGERVSRAIFGRGSAGGIAAGADRRNKDAKATIFRPGLDGTWPRRGGRASARARGRHENRMGFCGPPPSRTGRNPRLDRSGEERVNARCFHADLSCLKSLAEGLVDRGPAEPDDAGDLGNRLALSLKLTDGLFLLFGQPHATAGLAAAPDLALGTGGGLAGYDPLGPNLGLELRAPRPERWPSACRRPWPRSKPSFRRSG